MTSNFSFQILEEKPKYAFISKTYNERFLCIINFRISPKLNLESHYIRSNYNSTLKFLTWHGKQPLKLHLTLTDASSINAGNF